MVIYVGVRKSKKKLTHSKSNKKVNKKEFNFENIKAFFIKYFEIVKAFFKEHYRSYYLWMALPFVLIDVFMLLFGRQISYTNKHIFGPILFSLSWIILFIGSSLSFKKVIGKIVYSFFSLLFLGLFLVNNVYYSMTKTFFDFNLMESASEGAPYIFDALKNCNVFVYVCFVVLLGFFIYGLKSMPKIEKNNYKLLGIIFAIFLVLHTLAPFTLGKANKELTWSSWRNARNIYNSFNDCNKSIKVSGFYEYSARNFYVTFLKTKEKLNEEDIEFLDSVYSNEEKNKNKYTGKFKNKNLILVQLEGTDSWLLNKNDTPTMYKMMNEGISFKKHYSYYNGGGSTFNSEFAVNTGFITPLSYTRNAYSFNKNSFPKSLANLFKEQGYSVNAFHMNTGEYYSRTVNYKNWGYDKYYGLLDINEYTDETYKLDRELVLDEKFNELMFPTDTKFVDYIIAYSGHVPFDNTRGVCKLLYEEDNLDKETEFVQMTEEECVRRQARETDYMIELLVNNLKEKNLLDNTIIVIFTDHYLYTLEDDSILGNYKNTSNNLINNTPWFIWGKGVQKNGVKKVTSQLNILPTIINLYGIDYNVSDYIGEDALNPKYDGIVFFSDYSWYDGNVYVENGEVVNGKKISDDKLEEKNQYINYITKKNDLTLKYNYFKK